MVNINVNEHEGHGFNPRTGNKWTIYSIVIELVNQYGLGQDVLEILLNFIGKANYNLLHDHFNNKDLKDGWRRCLRGMSRRDLCRVHWGRVYLGVSYPRIKTLARLGGVYSEKIDDEKHQGPWGGKLGCNRIYGMSLQTRQWGNGDVHRGMDHTYGCDELNGMCKRAGLPGYSKLRKHEKICRLLRNETNQYCLKELMVWLQRTDEHGNWKHLPLHTVFAPDRERPSQVQVLPERPVWNKVARGKWVMVNG